MLITHTINKLLANQIMIIFFIFFLVKKVSGLISIDIQDNLVVPEPNLFSLDIEKKIIIIIIIHQIYVKI